MNDILPIIVTEPCQLAVLHAYRARHCLPDTAAQAVALAYQDLRSCAQAGARAEGLTQIQVTDRDGHLLTTWKATP